MKPRLLILTNRLIGGGISNDIIPLAYYLQPYFDILILYGEKKGEGDYNGFLCEIKNSVSLAEKMEKVLKMKESCLKELGNNGRKKVIAEFHEDFVLKHYERVTGEYLN